ncbi:MAG: ABC transporter permease [Candidatus Muiribacteriota bacterium]
MYLTLLKIKLKNITAYKFNNFFNIASYFFSFIIFMFLWNTIFKDTDNVAGYSHRMIITYYAFSIILSRIYLPVEFVNIGNDIRTGELSNFLIKPVSYCMYYMTSFISFVLFNIIFLIILSPFLIIFFGDYINISVQNIYFLILILFINVFLTFFISYFFSLISFWTEQTGGIFSVLFFIYPFFAGTFLPLELFPENIQNIFYKTPLPYLVYYPLTIINGKASQSSILTALQVILIWLFIFWTGSIILYKKGIKKYSGYGI